MAKDDDFNTWGWRIPLLFSLVLFGISISMGMGMGMEESPAFKKMKAEKRLSKSPLRETLLDKTNLRRLVIALFGICGNMTCAYSIAVLYPTFFMTQNLKVDPQQANTTLTVALVTALPIFLLAAWLCDRLGRKFNRTVARRHAEQQPATAALINARCSLGQMERVTDGDDNRSGAQRNIPGLPGKIAELGPRVIDLPNVAKRRMRSGTSRNHKEAKPAVSAC